MENMSYQKLLTFYDYLMSKAQEEIIFHNINTYKYSATRRKTYEEILRSFRSYLNEELEYLIQTNNEIIDENKEE